jgi:hypothetical protein
MESLLLLGRNRPQGEVLGELPIAGQQVDDGVFVGRAIQDSEQGTVVGKRDARGIYGLRVGHPFHESVWDEEKKDRKHNRQHPPLVLDINEELGEPDAHSEGLLPIRVAVLEAVGLLLFISEALVALRNQDESRLRVRVAHIFIRVILDRQFSNYFQIYL